MARPSKSCVTIAIAIALAFCMRIWMTGVFGLIDASHVEDEWIKVDALVVGRNSTTFASPDEDAKMYFCARVEFASHFGENITAISTTDCVLDALAIVIGSYIPIIYNPAYPKEFVEQDVLESELVSLKIMVGVGITVSIILSGAVCLLMNRQHRRRQPLNAQDSVESSSDPTETSEERKEKILSKLYTVTVLEDSSNTAASSIRSMSKLDGSADAKTQEATEGSTEAVHDNNEEKQSKDADGNDNSANNQGESSSSSKPESLRHHQPSSTLSFLSSLIRPTHDAECCICLDHYQPGEVICASKSEECNHVFHKECLIPWMMKNNGRCPLCRVDFMKEDNDDPEA